MIVTLGDCRGTADSNTRPNSNEPLKDDKPKFTVAGAGLLKLKLQALNDALTQTPPDRHNQLQFDAIVKGTSSRTYVNGSEEVYFMSKSLPWPEDIPDVFTRAYREVLQSRPFTNVYIPRPFDRSQTPGTIAARFAPTFSDVRPMLLGLDAVCNTTLSRFFQDAEQKVHSFPFLRLPTELRLHVYECIVPRLPYIPMYSRLYPRRDGLLPEGLNIMRVSKTIRDEVTKHCFGQTVLLFRACRMPQLGTTQECFTSKTTEDYAEQIMSISPKVKHRITRLEIQILPTEESRRQSLGDFYSLVDKLSLREICDALPNLESILFSYPRPDPESSALIQGLWGRMNYYKEGSLYSHNQKVTLEWIREQLWQPVVGGPRIVWDLTYFRDFVQDAEQLRNEILSERMMRELIERNDTLELAQSASANSEDLQRWAGIKSVALQAIRRR